MDILDTSVVRGVSKQKILAIARVRPVAVSPYTLWELLCHLDELRGSETTDEAFQRRKGHIAILGNLDILHDPFAQQAATVGAEELANPTRFEDKAAAKELIRRIVRASTLADLENEVFEYEDGSKGQFRQIAERARNALRDEEEKFIAAANRIWGMAQSTCSVKHPAHLSDNDLWEILKAALTALKRSYEQDGVAPDALLSKVCESMFPYYGYLLARLRTYGVRDDGSLAMQPNDTEDGFLCLHLRLFEDDLLVTGDASTRNAVNCAMELWNTRVTKLRALYRAVSIDEYSDLYLPTT